MEKRGMDTNFSLWGSLLTRVDEDKMEIKGHGYKLQFCGDHFLPERVRITKKERDMDTTFSLWGSLLTQQLNQTGENKKKRREEYG